MVLSLNAAKPVTVKVLDEAGQEVNTYTGAGQHTVFYGGPRPGTSTVGSTDWITNLYVANTEQGLAALKAATPPVTEQTVGTSAASSKATISVEGAPQLFDDYFVLAQGELVENRAAENGPVTKGFVANTFLISKTPFDRLGPKLGSEWDKNRQFVAQ